MDKDSYRKQLITLQETYILYLWQQKRKTHSLLLYVFLSLCDYKNNGLWSLKVLQIYSEMSEQTFHFWSTKCNILSTNVRQN